ncbi:hypothetical protein BH20ACI1_BH20ACI1_22430 [soil metagenome]
MNMQKFADALASKDLERYSQWFADDIRLYTPIHEEPTVGKQAACQILTVVFSIFENFRYPDIITGQQTHALFFRAEIEGISLEGIDYARTNENGLVTEFSVMMRPLQAITALSEAIGVKMQNS